jgi:hypothetical protein
MHSKDFDVNQRDYSQNGRKINNTILQQATIYFHFEISTCNYKLASTQKLVRLTSAYGFTSIQRDDIVALSSMIV